MQDRHPWISFTQVQPGTPGAQSLNSFVGTNATCSVCHKSFPVSAGDVAAHIQAHGQPQSTAVFKVTVDHGTHP